MAILLVCCIVALLSTSLYKGMCNFKGHTYPFLSALALQILSRCWQEIGNFKSVHKISLAADCIINGVAFMSCYCIFSVFSEWVAFNNVTDTFNLHDYCTE